MKETDLPLTVIRPEPEEQLKAHPAPCPRTSAEAFSRFGNSSPGTFCRTERSRRLCPREGGVHHAGIGSVRSEARGACLGRPGSRGCVGRYDARRWMCAVTHKKEALLNYGVARLRSPAGHCYKRVNGSGHDTFRMVPLICLIINTTKFIYSIDQYGVQTITVTVHLDSLFHYIFFTCLCTIVSGYIS